MHNNTTQYKPQFRNPGFNITCVRFRTLKHVTFRNSGFAWDQIWMTNIMTHKSENECREELLILIYWTSAKPTTPQSNIVACTLSATLTCCRQLSFKPNSSLHNTRYRKMAGTIRPVTVAQIFKATPRDNSESWMIDQDQIDSVNLAPVTYRHFWTIWFCR